MNSKQFWVRKSGRLMQLINGGYNHFELRNHTRHYTLKENGKVVFEKGDRNPAMEEARDWLENTLLNL